MSEQAPRLGSAARILGKAAQHQLPNRFGDHIDRQCAPFVLGGEFSLTISIKRRRAGQAFEERDHGGIHVPRWGSQRATVLFGRQVERRRPIKQPPAVRCPEPKVNQPDPASRGKDHVLRLDVTVRQAYLVTGSERAQGVLEHDQRSLGADSTLLQEQGTQRGPADVIADNGSTIVALTVPVDAGDSGFPNPRQAHGVTRESGTKLTVSKQFGGQVGDHEGLPGDAVTGEHSPAHRVLTQLPEM